MRWDRWIYFGAQVVESLDVTVPGRASVHLADEIADSRVDALERMLAEERRSAAREVAARRLARMPARVRRVAELCLEYGPDRAALVCGMTPQDVRALLSKAGLLRD